MTELEKYILTNREAFDHVEVPPNKDKLWSRIQRDCSPYQRRVIPLTTVFQWAVAASIGLLVGMWLVSPAPEANSRFHPVLASDIYPELESQEHYYQTIIEQKKLTLDLASSSDATYQEVVQELAHIDQLLQEYLATAPQNMDRQAAIETIIRFYERKVKILERLNRVIEKKQRYHEKVKREIVL